MGVVRDPQLVKYFVSIIFGDEERMESAKERTKEIFGDICDGTDSISFDQTDYYEREMGSNLSRVFLSFDTLFPRERLPEVKLRTNDIEALLSEKGKRTVNIDPGYVSLENVVLATTKGYSHRIYLGSGIYGDLTLRYHKGTYRPLEWTYPDYGSEEAISLFRRWRISLKESIKTRCLTTTNVNLRILS
jgi:hypothetical protein